MNAHWLHLDWNDPIIIGLVAVIALVALWRRWAYVLLAVLVLALGSGLDYLLRHAAVSPSFAEGAIAAVYLLGALLLAFLLIAGYVSKKR